MSTEIVKAVTTAPSALGFVRPTRRTLFWRTFAPWQLLRFIVINLRISAMILKSHDTRVAPRR
ncbi:MAG: hypothetical protein ACOZQL_19630 [Myxococcota bacterium]